MNLWNGVRAYIRNHEIGHTFTLMQMSDYYNDFSFMKGNTVKTYLNLLSRSFGLERKGNFEYIIKKHLKTNASLGHVRKLSNAGETDTLKFEDIYEN